MDRRQFVAATGTIGFAGLAGCLDGETDGSSASSENSTDEDADDVTTTSEEDSTDDGADVSTADDDSASGDARRGYETEAFDGVDVPLAPLEDVYEWYEDDSAKFVDARSRSAYEDLRIEGAVHSPQPDGLDEDDPVEGWDTDTRIVTYCVCPHAQAGMRASSLIDDGYENVYALDEGLRAWHDEGYPVAGERVAESLPSYDVRGRTDPAYAGKNVWVRHPATGQREPAKIGPDGTYEVTLHFTRLDEESELVLETPETTVDATLAELTDGVVTA